MGALFTSPLIVNVGLYTLILILAYMGMKQANGFFAVMEIYAIIGIAGVFGPIIASVINLVLFGFTKDTGFLVALAFAGFVLTVFRIVIYYESHDWFVDKRKRKKMIAIFETTTQLNPNEYIDFILIGGRGQDTQIHFKKEVEPTHLRLFFEVISKLKNEQKFQVHVKSGKGYLVKNGEAMM